MTMRPLMKMNKASHEAIDYSKLMSNQTTTTDKGSMIIWTPTGSRVPTMKEKIILREMMKNCQKEYSKHRWKASGRRPS